MNREEDSTMRTTVTYLFDPLCGWCYGASPAIQKLGQHGGLTLELAPTGLFAGGGRTMDAAFADYAWSNDLRIAKLTGQRFTEAYRSNVLGRHGSRFDSAATTLALTAVSLSEPQRELETLKALQEAHYVQGRWREAHNRVQDDGSELAAWLHGTLHIQEGDLEDAEYWYGKANRHFRSRGTLDEELERFEVALLRGDGSA